MVKCSICMHLYIEIMISEKIKQNDVDNHRDDNEQFFNARYVFICGYWIFLDKSWHGSQASLQPSWFWAKCGLRSSMELPPRFPNWLSMSDWFCLQHQRSKVKFGLRAGTFIRQLFTNVRNGSLFLSFFWKSKTLKSTIVLSIETNKRTNERKKNAIEMEWCGA